MDMADFKPEFNTLGLPLNSSRILANWHFKARKIARAKRLSGWADFQFNLLLADWL